MDHPDKQILSEEVLKSLKDGNGDAFETVYRFYRKKLFGFVFSYTKSEYATKEIVQEVFIKIWEGKEKIKPETFDSYLFTIARNLTLNYLRDTFRRETSKEKLWNNICIEYNPIEAGMISLEYQKIIDNIVKGLPPKKQSIYMLSREEGKNNGEIASTLGISEKTVRNHLWKIMEKIKIELRPYLDNGTYLIVAALLRITL
ncbi:RNA polymerase sigma factor [Sinomicrobium sp. M5D2P17]